MQVITTQTPEQASLLVAEIIANRLQALPAMSLALPTGNTPLLAYKHLRNLWKSGDLQARKASLVQIDEYIGSEETFRDYLQRELGSISWKEQLFWQETDDPKEIAQRLPQLDLLVLGIGVNGHVAFCEPGCSEDDRFYKTSLSEETIRRNNTTAHHALSMGIGYIKEAKEIILLATGKDKAEALAAAIDGPRTNMLPASLLQDHSRITVVCDLEAGSLLQNGKTQWSDRAVVVIGCRQEDGTYSPSSRGRVWAGSRLAATRGADIVLLSGGYAQDHQSEAFWMSEEFPARIETPLLLEEASDRTARHAAFVSPILRALGIKEVFLVTSWWHLPRFWWMQRWIGKEFRARFVPAWSLPFRGMKGQKRLRKEIGAFFWARADSQEGQKLRRKKSSL